MFFDDEEPEEFGGENRLVQSTKGEYDFEENVLRPKTLEAYVGQSKVKENLKVYMNAAKTRGEVLEHVLLYGAPGLGKTTLAHIISNEMGGQLKMTSAPAIERSGDLAAILTNLNEGDVLFIDEIHRLNHSVEEILYSAMEDYALDIIVGKGPSARNIRFSLKKFTLIGATTRAGMIANPLRDRFGIICRLEMYTPAELKEIVLRSAKTLGIAIDDAAAVEISRRSRGTPRIANRLLKRVRDFSTVNGRRREFRARQNGDRRARARRDRQKPVARHDRKIRRQARRVGNPRRDDKRGRGHDRGRVRALSFTARLHSQNAARQNATPRRIRASGLQNKRKTKGAAFLVR